MCIYIYIHIYTLLNSDHIPVFSMPVSKLASQWSVHFINNGQRRSTVGYTSHPRTARNHRVPQIGWLIYDHFSWDSPNFRCFDSPTFRTQTSLVTSIRYPHEMVHVCPKKYKGFVGTPWSPRKPAQNVHTQAPWIPDDIGKSQHFSIYFDDCPKTSVSFEAFPTAEGADPTWLRSNSNGIISSKALVLRVIWKWPCWMGKIEENGKHVGKLWEKLGVPHFHKNMLHVWF